MWDYFYLSQSTQEGFEMGKKGFKEAGIPDPLLNQ
jgi:hypothetical protein